MIVLDTNVAAELMKPNPDRRVVTWLNKQPQAVLLTSVTVAEISFGIERLPEGPRKSGLEKIFEDLMELCFAADVLPFDDAAARTFGRLLGGLRRSGKTMTTNDGMIAAIALEHRCSLATRNVADFAHTGLRIINPWA